MGYLQLVTNGKTHSDLHGYSNLHVPTGTLLSEAAQMADIEKQQPSAGRVRCGRCVVQVTNGTVRRRSTLRLTPEDVGAGYALACQTIVEHDVTIAIPPQEKIERRLATDRIASDVTAPLGYTPLGQPLHRLPLDLPPPSMSDQTDDWSRLQTALRQQTGVDSFRIDLPLLRRAGGSCARASGRSPPWSKPTPGTGPMARRGGRAVAGARAG